MTSAAANAAVNSGCPKRAIATVTAAMPLSIALGEKGVTLVASTAL